jgi:hypothetical protein
MKNYKYIFYVTTVFGVCSYFVSLQALEKNKLGTNSVGNTDTGVSNVAQNEAGVDSQVAQNNNPDSPPLG